MVTAYQRGLAGEIGHKVVRTPDLLAWKARIERADHQCVVAARDCFFVGLALHAIAIGLVIFAGGALRRFNTNVAHSEMAIGIGLSAAISVAMLMVAAFTKPQSRGEVASKIVDRGFQNHGGHPVSNVLAMTVLLIALYGSFAMVESLRRTWTRRKVAQADVFEMARLLAEVCASPTGVPVNSLLKYRQTVDSLRLPVAALYLQGWIELQENGRVIVQRSPCKRSIAWNHPLAEIFGTL